MDLWNWIWPKDSTWNCSCNQHELTNQVQFTLEEKSLPRVQFRSHISFPSASLSERLPRWGKREDKESQSQELVFCPLRAHIPSHTMFLQKLIYKKSMKNTYMGTISSIYSLLSSFLSSSAIYLQSTDFSSFFPPPLYCLPKRLIYTEDLEFPWDSQEPEIRYWFPESL